MVNDDAKDADQEADEEPQAESEWPPPLPTRGGWRHGIFKQEQEQEQGVDPDDPA